MGELNVGTCDSEMSRQNRRLNSTGVALHVECVLKLKLDIPLTAVLEVVEDHSTNADVLQGE